MKYRSHNVNHSVVTAFTETTDDHTLIVLSADPEYNRASDIVRAVTQSECPLNVAMRAFVVVDSIII